MNDMQYRLPFGLAKRFEPTWLMDLTECSILTDKFPLLKILKDSLYYAASGFDGDPVKHMLGYFFSFVYVDYHRSHEQLMREIEGRGFKGYRLLGWRSVTREELVPNGWTPAYPRRSDGNPNRYRSLFMQPFCDWCVFERTPGTLESHGPARFCLLFLCGDGVATFQALYRGNHTFPRGVAIIQDGSGFGYNWTSFRREGGIFYRSVMENPYGQPEVLLNGGWGDLSGYHDPIWPEYPEELTRFHKTRGGGYVVWGP